MWLEQHQQAEVALEGRDSLLFHSACKIEKKFELLGKYVHDMFSSDISLLNC